MLHRHYLVEQELSVIAIGSGYRCFKNKAARVYLIIQALKLWVLFFFFTGVFEIGGCRCFSVFSRPSLFVDLSRCVSQSVSHDSPPWQRSTADFECNAMTLPTHKHDHAATIQTNQMTPVFQPKTAPSEVCRILSISKLRTTDFLLSLVLSIPFLAGALP